MDLRLITSTSPNYPFFDCCLCLDYHHKNQTNNGITLKLPNRKLSSWKTTFTNSTLKAAKSPSNHQEKLYTLLWVQRHSKVLTLPSTGQAFITEKYAMVSGRCLFFSISLAHDSWNWNLPSNTFWIGITFMYVLFYASHILENFPQSKNDLSCFLPVNLF